MEEQNLDDGCCCISGGQCASMQCDYSTWACVGLSTSTVVTTTSVQVSASTGAPTTSGTFGIMLTRDSLDVAFMSLESGSHQFSPLDSLGHTTLLDTRFYGDDEYVCFLRDNERFPCARSYTNKSNHWCARFTSGSVSKCAVSAERQSWEHSCGFP